MVELLKDFPPQVAAYRAAGAISQEEYQDVVMKRVQEVATLYGGINFLVLLETKMSNYSTGAFLRYLKVSFGYFFKWRRMAIVTNERWLRVAYRCLSPFVPGKIKSFKCINYESAKQWVLKGI